MGVVTDHYLVETENNIQIFLLYAYATTSKTMYTAQTMIMIYQIINY